MKITSAILAVLFAIFAIVQYNDPDPWLWISLYGFVAAIFGFAALGKYNKWPVLLGITVCLITMVRTLPGVWEFFSNQDGISVSQGMSNEYPYIELAREFGGALITILALVWLWWDQRS